jgi:hypothetical protein
MVRSQAYVILTEWPATILRLGSRIARGEANLPDDPHLPWWEMFLPNTPSLLLESGDLLTDENGRTYNASAVEKTQLGIRITAFQATT